MQYEEVYKYLIPKREPNEKDEILNENLPKKEQKWVRNELPYYFEGVEPDKSGELNLTPEQERYADTELQRCTNGLFIWINGKLRYITKKYYFYLQWWVLEDGTRPEYRDCDRRYFVFLEYFEAILWCLGIIRGKKRREGASSQATSNLVYECIFFTNTNCGLISKTKDDSKDTFTDMVAFGYKQLPPFLKPKQVNREESVTEYKFEQTLYEYSNGKKTKKINYSKVNYRAPVLNAYDRGRLSRVLLDEFGKLEKDVPASQLYRIIQKTLVKGVKRVGFAEMPSTCNSMSKGGSEFKKLWEQSATDGKSPSITRMIQYFSPAYDGYEGFIDEFGDSVIGEPTLEQYQYLVDKWVRRSEDGTLISELSEDDIKLGAKEYVLVKRRAGIDGDDLEEETRMNPTDDNELFSAVNQDCIFDQKNLTNQKLYLKDNPIRKRKIIFYRDVLTKKVAWRDADKKEENFCWEVVATFPLNKIEDSFIIINRTYHVKNAKDGTIGVDGISSSQGGKQHGSKVSGWVFRKYDVKDPENTGCFIGHIYGRPAEKPDLHEQMLLCSEFLGFPIYWELVADAYYDYFKERNRLGLLAKVPFNVIDPNKKKDRSKIQRPRGVPTDEFAISAGHDAMISYVKHYSRKFYWIELCDDLLNYNPKKRTPFDRAVSAMITLVGSLEPVYEPPPPKEPLLRTFKRSPQVA